MRALPPETPTIICPAMNTHMYRHPFTAKHLRIIQEELNYMVSGPQGTGRLACGDEGGSRSTRLNLGPGKMTDWRDIVSTIENYGATYTANPSTLTRPTAAVKEWPMPLAFPPVAQYPREPFPERLKTPPTPGTFPAGDLLHMRDSWRGPGWNYHSSESIANIGTQLPYRG